MGKMGGSAPIVDGLSVESGRPTGVQHRAPVNTRGPWPDRHFRGTDRDAIQPVLRLHGAARRLGWRPFQPQMGGDHLNPFLERSDYVHRSGQQRIHARAHAQRSDGRRRGVLRPRQLFAARTVSHGHPCKGDVDSSDGILYRSDSGGMARRTDSRQFRCAAPRRGMEILLHLLRRGRYRLGNTHGVQAQGQTAQR